MTTVVRNRGSSAFTSLDNCHTINVSLNSSEAVYAKAFQNILMENKSTESNLRGCSYKSKKTKKKHKLNLQAVDSSVFFNGMHTFHLPLVVCTTLTSPTKPLRARSARALKGSVGDLRDTDRDPARLGCAKVSGVACGWRAFTGGAR